MAQPTAQPGQDAQSKGNAQSVRSAAATEKRILCAIAIVALGLLLWSACIECIDLGWFSAGLPKIDAKGVAAKHEEMKPPKHPLEAAISFARDVQKNIDNNVRDYTATLIKQERIGNELPPEQICFVKVREKPFSVYMNFLAPPDVKGREVVYVEGQNDGKLIGHEGSGLKALAGAVPLAPTNPLAMLGQHYPITELGIANLTRRLIEIGEKDMAFGECQVWRNDDAKVGDRPCISITVVHPERRPNFLFHIARIFVDKELMVPLHYEAFDWPEKPGDTPPLIEQYTYARLTLNPGLTDEDFDPHNPQYNFYSK